jgi:spore coat polysaccharide biosynthesis predicted glycosyltransferase SpsG
VTKLFTILFRFDASLELGLGHLCRCRSLATEFIERTGVEVTVSCRDKNLVLSSLKGFAYRFVRPQDIFDKLFFDVIVIDVPDCSLELQQSFKKVCKLLVGIDDWGMGPYVYDIMIRPNVLNLNQPRLLEANAQTWQGKNYIILHPAYAKLDVGFKERAKEVLVCFGGSDPSGLTLRVVPIMIRVLTEDIKMNLVIGTGFAKAEKIYSIIHNHKNARVFQNLPNLAGLFSSCDTAVVSGGTLLYEACALGIPAVVLAQELEQDEETELFAEKKAVLRPNNGLYASDNAISGDIQKICFDTALRRMLSRNARRCVSRGGTQRIVKKILSNLSMR